MVQWHGLWVDKCDLFIAPRLFLIFWMLLLWRAGMVQERVEVCVGWAVLWQRCAIANALTPAAAAALWWRSPAGEIQREGERQRGRGREWQRSSEAECKGERRRAWVVSRCGSDQTACRVSLSPSSLPSWIWCLQGSWASPWSRCEARGSPTAPTHRTWWTSPCSSPPPLPSWRSTAPERSTVSPALSLSLSSCLQPWGRASFTLSLSLCAVRVKRVERGEQVSLVSPRCHQSTSN